MSHPLVPGPVSARVLVKGASSAVAVAPSNGPQAHMNFARQLETLLPAKGLPVQVMNTSREGQTVHAAMCEWADGEYVWAPDVVVLNYGMYECVNLFLPHRIERHTNNRHHHPGWMRQRYRERMLKPAWRNAAKLQFKIQNVVGPHNNRRIVRAVNELTYLAREIRDVGQPLVLVMDLWSPAPPWTTWFGGLAERATDLNAALRERVAAIDDPGIRMFELGRIVNAHDPSAAVPDGMHFSAQVHGEIAVALANEIIEWASTQEHLKHP